MTELEAVNQMIEMLGEPTVTSLPATGEDANIDTARTVFSRVSQQVQAARWVSNTIYAQEIALDGDSKIPLPANTIAPTTALRRRLRGVVAAGASRWNASVSRPSPSP